MERRKRTQPASSGRVAKPASEKQESISLPLPYIAELIEYGEITIGNKYPVGQMAAACDEHNCLAMLMRQKGETLAALLTRLDKAIALAIEEEIFTDEINPR